MDLYEKFEKRGEVVEKRGRRKRNPCPLRLWIRQVYTNNYYITKVIFTADVFKKMIFQIINQ
jgi:hypothetical protein